MPPVIKVESLSKRYRLGQIGGGTLYGDLNRWWARVRGAPDPTLKIGQQDHGQRDGEYIWALRDVSFEVQQGEVLGIIGKNGAGKSTLLKILSRITAPTSGEVKLKGRVGSLLEVGTGFHPELTGRENIYLNGAILGMSTGEVARKFDEIVDFSGVEQFIDTPVKRYSSGMYVRLAFAVAAHLDPEILVVDEVLAVGDAEFQKKCLGKMDQVAKEEGRTILFVSHNMGAVQNLCDLSLVIENGIITFAGITSSAITYYLQGDEEDQNSDNLSSRKDRRGDQSLKFTKIEILDKNNNLIKKVLNGQDIKFRFYYTAIEEIKDAEVHVSFVVKDKGYNLTNINSIDSGFNRLPIFKYGYFECNWLDFNLTAREYECSLFCSINGIISDWVDSAFTIDVENGDFYNSGKFIGWQSKFLVSHSWSSKKNKRNSL